MIKIHTSASNSCNMDNTRTHVISEDHKTQLIKVDGLHYEVSSFDAILVIL